MLSGVLQPKDSLLGNFQDINSQTSISLGGVVTHLVSEERYLGFSCLSGLPAKHSAFRPILTSIGDCVTDSFCSFCDVNLVAALLSTALSSLLN